MSLFFIWLVLTPILAFTSWGTMTLQQYLDYKAECSNWTVGGICAFIILGAVTPLSIGVTVIYGLVCLWRYFCMSDILNKELFNPCKFVSDILYRWRKN